VDIRDRIRAVLDEKGLSARKVSLDAGLSDSALHKFLTGSTDSLTLKTVDKIADALGVDPRWLAYGEGDPEPAGELTHIWERIAERDRDQARRVLESFTRTGTDN
jgi:transcriptional regulator with XRE-family HTH domain